MAAFSSREVKRAVAEDRERAVEIEIGSKVIPTRFLKIERRTLVGIGDRRKRNSVKNRKMVKTNILMHLPRTG